jgi:hypothetical protein
MAISPDQMPVLDALSQAALSELEELVDKELRSKFCSYDRQITLEIPLSRFEEKVVSFDMVSLLAIFTELIKKYHEQGWLNVSIKLSSYYIYVKLTNPRPLAVLPISIPKKTKK